MSRSRIAKRTVTPPLPRPSGRARAAQNVLGCKQRKICAAQVLVPAEWIDLDSEVGEAVSDWVAESIPVTPLPVSARTPPSACARSDTGARVQRQWMLDDTGFVTYTPTLPVSINVRVDPYHELLTFIHRVRTLMYFGARCIVLHISLDVPAVCLIGMVYLWTR
jgi:hypothetical protein